MTGQSNTDFTDRSGRRALADAAFWASLRGDRGEYDDDVEDTPEPPKLRPCEACTAPCRSRLCRDCLPRTRLKGER